jgi:predicted dehydrogenase
MKHKEGMDRREFLGSAAATAAVTIVPRHVLGGPGYVPPSDRLTMAIIGCGTQGTREMVGLVRNPEIQWVAACDVVSDGNLYLDWSTNGIRNSIRSVVGEPTWSEGTTGIRCGHDVMKYLIETYYAKNRGQEKYSGCNTYVDYRELLSKEKDLDAVKIVTPDHHHAWASIAAMKAGKHVMCQKPIANRVSEVRMVLETARTTGKATYCNAWRGPLDNVKQMIDEGQIGTLREVHNWTDRPFWPQYQYLPTDTPPVPDFLNWDLWLGPAADRAYHPHYTNCVFRGWHDFGGGSIADMGNYSLWPIFVTLDLPIPNSVEVMASSSVAVVDGVSRINVNDFSFPNACMVRFKFPAQGNKPPISLYWYDGGMRPWAPEQMESGRSMPATGTMFVGDKGVILDNNLVPESRMKQYRASKGIPEPDAGGRRGGDREAPWIQAFKTGKPGPGNFLLGTACSEAIALAGAALRHARKGFRSNVLTPPYLYEARSMSFTNVPEANPYLSREYRQGWRLTAAGGAEV